MYKAVNDQHCSIGNSATSKVKGKEIMVLQMSLEKELTLVEVLHVSNIHKNMTSNSILAKKEF